MQIISSSNTKYDVVGILIFRDALECTCNMEFDINEVDIKKLESEVKAGKFQSFIIMDENIFRFHSGFTRVVGATKEENQYFVTLTKE